MNIIDDRGGRRMRPWPHGHSPAIALSRMLLPDPEAPVSTTRSPRRISAEGSPVATTSPGQQIRTPHRDRLSSGGRKNVVSGRGVTVRVDFGGSRLLKTKPTPH